VGGVPEGQKPNADLDGAPLQIRCPRVNCVCAILVEVTPWGAVNSQVYSRYRCVYTLVEFAAAVAFVIGSVCFFSEDLTLQADWLFLIGSILFAVRPTVAVIREVHLARIPLAETDGQPAATRFRLRRRATPGRPRQQSAHHRIRALPLEAARRRSTGFRPVGASGRDDLR
jgi:hypothetical protein